MPIAILYYKVSPESINSAQIAAWMKELPIIKQNRVKKLHQQKDQVLSLAGLQLLKLALADFPECDLSLKELEFPERGKPFFKDDVDFNISHSGDVVCCALSNKTKVGLDIEVIRPIQPATINKYLPKLESLKKRLSTEDIQRQFFAVWTQNEAIIKAADSGSVHNMNEIKLKPKGGHYKNHFWFTYPVEIMSKDENKEYTCHIACSESIEDTMMNKITAIQIHNL